ncbi:hypothetical protein BDZ45DRAFT_593776 [Acephala macrosclerotiorum]|nr:hypothetical protein BDZ45DRAFT_593776 [Acephala macrosclerotiorum]
MSSLFPPPQNNTLVWRPESRTRGSFNILSTCLITLVSCVWTAVHLNLPKHEDSNDSDSDLPLRQRIRRWFTSRQFLWRKCAWVVLGLLTPEMVTLFSPVMIPPFLALECYQLKDDLDWQKIHAYYGTMGGFAFHVGTDAGLPFEGRMTITPAGLRFLATYAPELIPRITPAEIEDKSKADGLAKFLVCIQATWFCLQCVTRMAQRLSISLLELNTFAHALCALFTYTRWWKKPLSIREPSLVKSESGNDCGHEIWALLYLATIANVGQEGPKQRHGFARNSTQESTKVYLIWDNKHNYETSKHHPFVPEETPSIGSPSAFFGGLHLIAWNAYFPSFAEMMLWRISALAITALGPALAVGNALALIVCSRRKTSDVMKVIGKGLRVLITLPSIFYAALYTFARVYIIVACFINLVHFSDAAFQVPTWSKYFPHVS